MAAFDTSTAALHAWNPNPNGSVLTVSIDGTRVFAGGEFSSAGPGHEYTGSLVRLTSAGTVDASWTPVVRAPTLALAINGTDVFAGGQFARVGNGFVSR